MVWFKAWEDWFEALESCYEVWEEDLQKSIVSLFCTQNIILLAAFVYPSRLLPSFPLLMQSNAPKRDKVLRTKGLIWGCMGQMGWGCNQRVTDEQMNEQTTITPKIAQCFTELRPLRGRCPERVVDWRGAFNWIRHWLWASTPTTETWFNNVLCYADYGLASENEIAWRNVPSKPPSMTY